MGEVTRSDTSLSTLTRRMTTLRLAPRAERELLGLGRQYRKQMTPVLYALTEEPWPKTLNVRPLAGTSGWYRLRVGNYRALFKPQDHGGERVILVARIVDRRDLERAIKTL